MRIKFAVLILLLFCGTAFAAPKFPALTGRVVDGAGLLSPSTKQQLENTLAQHEAATTNQIVVVTVKSLDGYEIEDYGYQLGRFWGIGQKGKNNGVLLIVAPNERSVRIEVGYGLEGVLTDAITSKIIHSIILPQFKAGQMEQGITDGTIAIISVLEGKTAMLEKAAAEQPQQQEEFPAWAIILFILFIFFLRMRFGIWFLPLGGGGFRSGGSSFRGGGGSFGGGGSSGRW